MRAGHSLLLKGALLSMLVGCAGSRPTQKAPDTSNYLSKVRERIRASRSAEAIYDVRINPTHCGCPRFELRLEGLWHRLALEGDLDDEGSITRVLSDADPMTLKIYRVQGQLRDTLDTCAQGTLYVTMTPLALDESPGTFSPSDQQIP